jgi:hypothetical protein
MKTWPWVSWIAVLLLVGCSRGARVQPISSPAERDGLRATDPAIAAEPRGTVYLAWLSEEAVSGQGATDSGWRLRFSRSADAGQTWTTPVTITAPTEPIHPHAESSPRLIVAPGNRLALFWSTSSAVPGREWPASNVRFSRSLDGGRSWSVPITLNDDSLRAPGSHSFHGAALFGDSGLVVAWLDERPAPSVGIQVEGSDNASIYVARSEDFGRTWKPNIGRWGSVCPCCRVSVTADRVGNIVTAWRRHFPGQVRDVVISTLDAEPSLVHRDGWKIAGCPHSGPSVALGKNGALDIAWYTGASGRAGVYYAHSSISSLGKPEPLLTAEGLPVAHVSLASNGLETVVACDVTPGGESGVSLFWPRPQGDSGRSPFVIPGSAGADHPQVAQGEAGVAFVAWSQTQGDRTSVRLARIHGRS